MEKHPKINYQEAYELKDRLSEGLKKEMAVRALFLANYIAFANKSSCEEDNLEIDKKFSLLCEVDNISREISKEIDRIGGVEFVDDEDMKLNHVDRIVYDLSDEAEDYLENEGRVNDIPVSGDMVEYAKEFKENDSYDYSNMTQYIDIKNEVFNTKEYLDRFSIINLHQLSYETKNNIEADLRNKLIDKGYSDDVMMEYHDGRMEASYRDNVLKYLEERPIFIRRDQGNN